jgi:hypothetical protein
MAIFAPRCASMDLSRQLRSGDLPALDLRRREHARRLEAALRDLELDV